MRNIFWIFLATAMLVSCNFKKKEVVEKTYPSGKKKVVAVYKDPDTKKEKEKETYYHENGKVYIDGKFEQNKKSGLWVSFYPDGKKWSETTFKDDAKNGATTTYYENGKKRYEGFYTNNKPSGNWIFWDVHGNEVLQRNFDKEPIAEGVKQEPEVSTQK